MSVAAPTARLAVAALGALALASRPALAQFEGKVTMTMTSARGAMPVEMFFKDGVSRMEMASQAGAIAMIMDPVKKEMITIIPEGNMFMKRSTEMPANPNMPAAAERKKVEFKKAGKSETIAGVTCEHYTVTEESGDSDVCLASGMGTFMGMGGGMGRMGGGMGRMGGGGGGGGGGGARGPGGGGGQMAWSRDLEKGMFPLKVVNHEGMTVLLVTAIEKKKLDAAMFAVPEGYQDMSGMMGGGGGARPPQF